MPFRAASRGHLLGGEGARCKCLVCASKPFALKDLRSLTEHNAEGPEQDGDILQKGKAFSVADVEVNHLLKCSIILTAHLPQPGKTRHGLKTGAVLRTVLLVLIRDAWPWPDQAHFAAEHIEYLRQLIQTGCPQQYPNLQNARVRSIEFLHGRVGINELCEVLLMTSSFRGMLHGPKLETHEAFTLQTNSFLAEKDGPGGGEPNGRSD